MTIGLTAVSAKEQSGAASARARVSVVIPLFNSGQTVAALVERLCEVFGPRGLQVVLVNDGSRDRTHQVCLALADRYPDRLTYLELAKNFGEHNAVMAGLRYAQGEYVVIMDDDFQHRPEDALRLVEEARTRGLDLVYSSYPQQAHAWFRVLGSRFNGFVANLMLDKPKNLYLSSFKCMSRWLVAEVTRYEGPFPYVDGLALRCTRSIGCVEVVHQPRTVGRSGYTLRKLARLWLNMFVNFSVVPLRVGTLIGLVMVAGGALLGGYVMWEKLSGRLVPTGWTFLVIILLFFSGAQLLMLGLIGEYLGRLLLSVNATPQFVVRASKGLGISSDPVREHGLESS